MDLFFKIFAQTYTHNIAHRFVSDLFLSLTLSCWEYYQLELKSPLYTVQVLVSPVHTLCTNCFEFWGHCCVNWRIHLNGRRMLSGGIFLFCLHPVDLYRVYQNWEILNMNRGAWFATLLALQVQRFSSQTLARVSPDPHHFDFAPGCFSPRSSR